MLCFDSVSGARWTIPLLRTRTNAATTKHRSFILHVYLMFLFDLSRSAIGIWNSGEAHDTITRRRGNDGSLHNLWRFGINRGCQNARDGCLAEWRRIRRTCVLVLDGCEGVRVRPVGNSKVVVFLCWKGCERFELGVHQKSMLPASGINQMWTCFSWYGAKWLLNPPNTIIWTDSLLNIIQIWSVEHSACRLVLWPVVSATAGVQREHVSSGLPLEMQFVKYFKTNFDSQNAITQQSYFTFGKSLDLWSLVSSLHCSGINAVKLQAI